MTKKRYYLTESIPAGPKAAAAAEELTSVQRGAVARPVHVLVNPADE